MELRLWTALGLLLVITVGAVVGATVVGLVLPGGTSGAAPAPDSGADARAPSVDAPDPGLLARAFRYAVAFGLGGLVGLFLGILVGQKAARSRSSEPIPDRHDEYGAGAENPPSTASQRHIAEEASPTLEADDGHPAATDTSDGPWESNR
jgi:hypothetical protein